MLLLDQKLGKIEPRLMSKIQQLSTQKLEELAADLLDFSETEDLEAWLGYPEK